jgi:hypothetical protein
VPDFITFVSGRGNDVSTAREIYNYKTVVIKTPGFFTEQVTIAPTDSTVTYRVLQCRDVYLLHTYPMLASAVASKAFFTHTYTNTNGDTVTYKQYLTVACGATQATVDVSPSFAAYDVTFTRDSFVAHSDYAVDSFGGIKRESRWQCGLYAVHDQLTTTSVPGNPPGEIVGGTRTYYLFGIFDIALTGIVDDSVVCGVSKVTPP